MSETTKIKGMAQLGVSIDNAHYHLRRILIFEYAKKFGMDNCYRCGEKITIYTDMALDHKSPWRQSLDNPKGMFFDIDNVALSHLSCNSRYAVHGKWTDRGGMSRLEYHRMIELRDRGLLGESVGGASRKLYRIFLHKLVCMDGAQKCFRCGVDILDALDMTIEHKTPWLDVSVESFWDLENIAFSHGKCNSSHTRCYHKIVSPDGYTWCAYCKSHKPVSEFYKLSGPQSRNGYNKCCRDCSKLKNRKYSKR